MIRVRWDVCVATILAWLTLTWITEAAAQQPFTSGTFTQNTPLASGVTVSGTAMFTNNSTISLSTVLINALGATFTNNGTINGFVGVYSGTFVNTGSGAITASELQVGGAGGGSGFFTNNGSITGPVQNPQGTFINTGTITGAVTNGNGSGATEPSFTNIGTIIGNVFSTSVFTNTVGSTITGDFSNSFALVNNGTISGTVTNQPYGFNRGSGTMGNLVNYGSYSPGNSIGTLTVTGNHLHSGSGTYLAEVNGAGQSDLVRVLGAASLQGGTVSVAVLPGAPLGPRTTYRILTAAGGLSGSYAAVSDPYPFLLSSLSQDANNIYLTLQPGGFAAKAQTGTQAAVGAALDTGVAGASGDFATILGTLATLQTAQVLPFMTAISGQNYSAFSSTMVQGAALFMNTVADQTGGFAPAGQRVALAEACDVACVGQAAGTGGAWGGALGGVGSIGASTATGSVTYTAGGFAAGLDRELAPGFRLGVTAGYTSGRQYVSGFSGTGATDTFLAGLYGTYREGKVYADALAGYAYSDNQMWRQITVPGLGQRTAQGRTGANQFYGQIEAGYRVDIGPVGGAAAEAYLTPFARLQGYTGAQNGFSETGAQSLNLTVAAQTTNSLRSVIGAQLGGSVDLGWREKLAAQLRLGWSHDYASTARPVTATLAGAPLAPFTTYGVAPQRDAAVVGFSAGTAIAEATSVYLRYEGTISGADSAHGITAGVRMSW